MSSLNDRFGANADASQLHKVVVAERMTTWKDTRRPNQVAFPAAVSPWRDVEWQLVR